MKSPLRHIVLLLLLAALVGSSTSCSRLGMTEKLGLIVFTGGAAGTLLTYQSQAQLATVAASSAAASLLPAAATMVVDRVPATPEQIARVEIRAREIMMQKTPEEKQEMEKQEIKYLTIEVAKPETSRGQTAVMVYDIEKDTVAEPVIFDVRVAPEPGSKIQLDTYISEFVPSAEEPEFLSGAPQTVLE